MRTDSPQRRFPKVDPAWKIGIVAATFYREEIDMLIASAKDYLLAAGIPEANISIWEVPGSYEIPLLGEALADAKKVDAMLGLGIIVQGQTKHADLIAQESARGMMDIQLRHKIPFAFEILWVEALEHARTRGSKGEEAASAALHSLAELSRLHS